MLFLWWLTNFLCFLVPIDSNSNRIYYPNKLHRRYSTCHNVLYNSGKYLSIIPPICSWNRNKNREFKFQKNYIALTYQLKRIESIHKAPFYSHLVETLTGKRLRKSFSIVNRYLHRLLFIFDFIFKAFNPFELTVFRRNLFHDATKKVICVPLPIIHPPLALG